MRDSQLREELGKHRQTAKADRQTRVGLLMLQRK
jgi:hypothetical protein